jgi:hypothetical protein
MRNQVSVYLLFSFSRFLLYTKRTNFRFHLTRVTETGDLYDKDTGIQ